MTYVLDAYDNALRQILEQGVTKTNRTGVKARTIFGLMSRYRIDECFPVLTGRKVWPKSIWAELLWVLSGSSNNRDLQDLGSNIWTPWVDPEFEAKHHYASGSFGPVYGFNLRHFGGYYGDGSQTQTLGGQLMYGRGGTDQLAYMVRTLKSDPDSRRNLFILFDPCSIEVARLPPCHYTFQVLVSEGKLTGMLTQRSCDFPVGVPANIQFYSSLIYMLAQQCGLEPYEFVHSAADAHIYEDQVPAVEEYLAREKPGSPKLVLNKAVDMVSYQLSDFELVGYVPQPVIKIPVTV